MDKLAQISEALVQLKEEEVVALVKEAIDAKVPAEEILNNGLIAAMQITGKKFETGEFFLPELLVSGQIMKAGLNVLIPLLTKQEGGRHFVGTAVIGTVKEDIHDIGKNILVMMLEANGWHVTDLGIDVTPEQFCTAVKENDFQVLGMSALLTGTMSYLEQTIEALKEAGLRDKVKVAVGGAMVTQKYADQIGADCYASDANEAVRELNALIS